MKLLRSLQVIGDYASATAESRRVGFGNFNGDIACRAAELYHAGFAPKVLLSRQKHEWAFRRMDLQLSLAISCLRRSLATRGRLSVRLWHRDMTSSLQNNDNT